MGKLDGASTREQRKLDHKKQPIYVLDSFSRFNRIATLDPGINPLPPTHQGAPALLRYRRTTVAELRAPRNGRQGT